MNNRLNDVEIKYRLMQLNLCRYITEQQLELLLPFIKVIEFEQNATILSINKKIQGIYLIIEGEVLNSTNILASDDLEIENLVPGDFIGEMSLLNKECMTSYKAINHVLCFYFPLAYFELIMEFQPELYYNFLRCIAESVSKNLIEKHLIIKSAVLAITQQKQYYNLFQQIRSYRHSKKINLSDSQVPLQEIRDLPFFKNFTEEEFDKFFKMSSLYEGKKNCLLIKEEETSENYYLIIRGAVQTRIISQSKFIKISLLEPNGFFGPINFLFDKGSIINYITCENTLFLKIKEHALTELKKTNQQLWFKINNLILGSALLLNRFLDKAYIRLNHQPYTIKNHV